MSCLAPILLSCVMAAPPIVEQTDEREWTVEIEVNVRRYRQDPIRRDRDHELDTSVFNLVNTPVVFPILPEGTAHETDVENLQLTLKLNDREHPANLSLNGGYPLNTSLATWNIAEFKGFEFSFAIRQNLTCYDIEVRHDIAQALDWPETWPAPAQEALQEQMFVESDNTDLQKLVKSWTNDNIRSVSPYLAAKAITGQVIEYVQLTGKDWVNDDRGRFAGFDLTGSTQVLQTKRGTDNDIICFHVACLRAAGIPARPVIGMDARKKEFKVWTEFYLHDVERNEGVWLPIDFIQLRKRSSRAAAIDRPWPDFAEMDDYDFYIPLAHHFHPPTGVRNAGPPALWGFDPRPEAQAAEQFLTWKVQRTPKRGR
jgi:Transglutaminase-like superfamily